MVITVDVILKFKFSERACETNSGGQKLRDGANINKSLLALANCINALGKQQKKGLAYVPYRNRYASHLSLFHITLLKLQLTLICVSAN